MNVWRVRITGGAIAVATAVAVTLGCTKDPNDPQTWIDRLNQPALREEALSELTKIYERRLNKAGGNRSVPEIAQLNDHLVPGLVRAYDAARDDHPNRARMITLMDLARDRRAIPKYIEALDFTPDLNEDNAKRAAEALGHIEAAEGVEPLLATLARIRGNRPQDNFMRAAIVGSLGQIKDRRAVPALIRVLDTSPDEQDFLINKLAAEALGLIGDPQAVPVLIRGMFMIGRNATIFQECRVALAQIGHATVQPLIRAMRGDDADLNEMGRRLSFIEGVLQEKPTRVLGETDDPAAIPVLLEMLAHHDAQIRGQAGISLGKLGIGTEETRVTDALAAAVMAGEVGSHPGIVEGLERIGGTKAADALLRRARRVDEEGPGVAVRAAMAYARIAGPEGRAQFAELVRAQTEDEVRTGMTQYQSMLDAAADCRADLGCWVRLLNGNDEKKQEKAAWMLGRAGAGNAQAEQALTQHLGDPSLDVRAAVLVAVDRIHPHGCPACVARIDEVRGIEEGRQRYRLINYDAQCLRARLVHRAPR